MGLRQNRVAGSTESAADSAEVRRSRFVFVLGWGGADHPRPGARAMPGRTQPRRWRPTSRPDETPASFQSMTKQVAPFLMFQNADAEEAMAFYTALFDDGRILDVARYGAEGPGPEGTVV